MSFFKRNTTITILITILFVILSFIFTWPLISQPHTLVPFDDADGYGFLWNLWWVKYSLIDIGQNPFNCDYIFYPKGCSLALHDASWMNCLTALPLLLFLDLNLTGNIIFWLSFILSGLGVFLLCRHLTGSISASIYAGILFAFCPYRYAHAPGHLNLLSTQWLPFATYALIYCLERKSLFWAFMVGLGTVLIAGSSLYYLVFFLLFGSIYIIFWNQPFYKFFFPIYYQKKRILQFLIAILTFIILLLPWLRTIFEQIHKYGDYVSTPLNNTAAYSGDLLAYITPSLYHPLWGGFFYKYVSQNFSGNLSEWTLYCGISALILAILGAYADRKNNYLRPFWISGVIFFLLSLGPELHILGQSCFKIKNSSFHLPLPFFKFLYQIPILNMIRIPSRFALMVIFSVAVLSSSGLAWIASKVKERANGSFYYFLIFFFLLIILIIEILPIPIYTTRPKLPEYCQFIKSGEGEAVLQLPLGWRSGLVEQGSEITLWQYYQTYHQKKLFSGFCARIPSDLLDSLNKQPIISSILKLQAGEKLTSEQKLLDKDLASLWFHENKVKFAAIDNNCRHPLSAEVFENLKEYFLFLGGEIMREEEKALLIKFP